MSFCCLSHKFYVLLLLPGDPEKQGTLIRQLQEQHYFQYMQQLELSQRAEALNEKNILPENSELKSNGVVSFKHLARVSGRQCVVEAAAIGTLHFRSGES